MTILTASTNNSAGNSQAGTAPLENSDEQRYVRQEMLAGYEQSVEILSTKKVGLIGVGGLGGLCSLLLSNAGVGCLRLADGDSVAWHNLHRQLLFTEQDSATGELKVMGACRELERRNHHTKIEAFKTKITAENFADFADGLDLILDVSDDAKSREVLAQQALEHGKDLLSGAVSAYTALLAVFRFSCPNFVRQYGCYHCLTHGADINTKVGITGPIAASASSLVAHVALEYLLGHEPLTGQLLRYDFRRLNLQHLRLTPDPDCQCCRSLHADAGADAEAAGADAEAADADAADADGNAH